MADIRLERYGVHRTEGRWGPVDCEPTQLDTEGAKERDEARCGWDLVWQIKGSDALLQLTGWTLGHPVTLKRNLALGGFVGMVGAAGPGGSPLLTLTIPGETFEDGARALRQAWGQRCMAEAVRCLGEGAR